MSREVPDEQLRRVAAALRSHGHNQRAASRALGMNDKTLRNQMHRAIVKGLYQAPTREQAEVPAVEFPVLPDDGLSDDELLERVTTDFARRWQADQARDWYEVKVNDDRPIGICWMGDPHVDSDGCNWPLLRKHGEVLKNTEGLFGANLGDTTDNWIGRLARLYAHSHQDRNTAIQLAEILINKLGIKWIVLIRGNHDMWSNSRKDDPLSWIAKGQPAPLEDWRARFKLTFKNGRECKIHASHSFAGQSWFHPLHGNIRAALEEGIADLYISGHTHEYGVLHLNNAKRNKDYWLCKARGYKYIDHHAVVHGHESHKIGASVVTIIDPKAAGPNPIVACFNDVEEAAEYLKWKRR